MKILRVRLSNLASLQGESLVDFAGPILGNSPIFAITGRTGSGKSTLLDAICLALYGKTPRYDSGRNTAAEVEGIRGDDERNILRRGAGKGWAETDILGRDGLRYRARWEVQRAREKAGGNLQNAKMVLWKVTVAEGKEDLELIADRSEVTEKVEQKLGLNFRQFRHAVLLAQGEFKAFLEAKEAERSELLETITGTGIYSQLSREAYRRKTEGENRLHEMERLVEGIQVLAEDARARIEEDLLAFRGREAELSGECDALRKWLEWYEEETRKAAALAQAQSDYEATRQASRDHEADFARLRDWEALAPIRDTWVRTRERAADLEKMGQGKRQLLETRQGRNAEHQRLQDEEKSAREEDEAARLAREDAGPALIEARRLDEQCAQAASRVEDSSTRAKLLVEKWVSAAAALAQLARDLKEKQDLLDRDKQWQDEREALRPVFESQEAHGRRLQALQDQSSELEQKNAERTRMRQQEAECGQAWELTGRDRDAARASLDACRAQRDETKEACRALDAAALRERDRLLRERAGVLAGAERDEEDFTQLNQDLAAVEEGIASKTEQLGQTENQLPILSGQLESARQESGMLRTALEKLNRALASDLESLRAELAEDQPCPLCGSLQHPWAERAEMTALNEQLREMQGRCGVLAATEDRLTKEIGDRQAMIAGAQAALAQWGGQREQLRIKIQGRQEKLALIRQTVQDSRPFAEQSAENRLERESMDEQLNKLTELEATLENVQAQCDREAEANENLETLLRVREKERDTCRLGGEACAHAIERLQAQCADLKEELHAAFSARGEWTAALEEDLPRLMDELREEAEIYHQTRRRLEREEPVLREMRNRYAAEEASAKSLNEQGGQAQNEQINLSDALKAVQAKRAGLLGGEAADEREARLNERVQRAGQALTTIQASLTETKLELGELDGNLRQMDEQMDRLRKEGAQGQAEVDLFCQRKSITLEHIETIFAAGNEWLELTRKLREDLTREEEKRKGQVELLRDQLKTQRTAAPPQSREACATQLQTLEEEGQRIGNEKEVRIGQLGLDDENRKRLGDAQEQLKTARGDALVWQKLSEVIGSADGKKFRAYAQGLTLRALVEHANAHLRQLRPRFRLGQNKNATMDLVLIDHDMGDEVRPVRSLSGGESFLVSLALALGLSNMAARDLSIDSLFIDEGFGALDTDTFQMALAVLQGLHAQGKQVGIISHVEGIAQYLGAEVRVETVDSGQSRLNVRIAC